MDMFCFQCQETARNRGCTRRGVCGKEPNVAALQDLMIYLSKGLAAVGLRARQAGVAVSTIAPVLEKALFSTVTNVNFDPRRFVELGQEILAVRQEALSALQSAGVDLARLPEAVRWTPPDDEVETWVGYGRTVGVLADPDEDPDIRSLRELTVYGLKGIAAYAHHARVLGESDPEVEAFMQEALAATLDKSLSADELTALVLRCGEAGVKVMALLDRANTGHYGHPEPTEVNLGVVEGPAILISGHDLRDLEELLEQTKGTGVNVYTHGEMLPAHAYPFFKRYDNLVGNYGGAWWRQPQEFESFGGAILMTTNCLVPPRDSYKDRLFTTGVVGWPDVAHIPDRTNGPKDFSPVIEKALASASPKPLESGKITIGFAHETVLGAAEQVIQAIQRGEIKRFVVMAGCDGRHRSREYYTQIAQALPPDSIILTAGCAKYRYNKLDLGTVAGLPRVLDAGQCNDSYSLVVVALKLAEALGVESVNELPIAYDIAWYEQKAVTVLLALLSLGVKKIRLGPTLPAFLSPNVTKVLVERFDLRPIHSVEEDVAEIVAGV